MSSPPFDQALLELEDALVDLLENLAFAAAVVPALLADADPSAPFQGGLERYLDSLTAQGLALKTRVQSLRVRFSQEQLWQVEAPIWAAFLQEGLLESRVKATALPGHGQLELVAACCEYLPLVRRAVCARETLSGERTGVLEYEVLNPLGDFIGEHIQEHNSLPSEALVEDWLQRRLSQFFSHPPST
ncbi:MAG: hypothetical protein KDI30_00135 [Pseudomonadales bacterium]|nr:hypothetical protein [Pseudomonadales bacterium]